MTTIESYMDQIKVKLKTREIIAQHVSEAVDMSYSAVWAQLTNTNRTPIIDVRLLIHLEKSGKLVSPEVWRETKPGKYEPKFLSWCTTYEQEKNELRELIAEYPADEKQLRNDYETLTGKRCCITR